jgi:hypothetical protein
MSLHVGHAGHIELPRLGRRAPELGVIHATPLDIAGYWLALAGSYLLLLSLWYYAAEEKIIGNNFGLPASISKQFHGSFIASVPGTHAAWVTLGVLDGLVFVGLVVSLVAGEFMPHRPKTWLLGSAMFSLVVLALLVLGNSMTGNHELVLDEFAYFAATILVIFLVRVMPPYRSDRWLSGGDGQRAGSSPESR